MNIQTRPDPVARARELGAEITAAADEIERTRRIPEAVLGRLHDARLFRMLLPRSAGGDETEPAVYLAAVEELARHDASIAWNAFVANSSALIAAYLEPAVNHDIFADPRSIVAWGPPNASRATAVDIGYRLTGKWDFASGCRQARWMGAHCPVLEADGTLRLNRFGRPTVRTLLIPASEATLLDTWRTIGLCGTASDSYCVNDVFVSEAFSTTREDPTLPRERLACTNAIQGAVEVADFAYKGAGVDAIFPGSPFERRFRDMHTLSQQIQARTAHFEQVGRILLGVPPEEIL